MFCVCLFKPALAGVCVCVREDACAAVSEKVGDAEGKVGGALLTELIWR